MLEKRVTRLVSVKVLKLLVESFNFVAGKLRELGGQSVGVDSHFSLKNAKKCLVAWTR